MSEMKSLTLNDKTYDGFVDPVARALASATTVINSASGESVTLSDASDSKLLGLRIYGKTTQGGTPTPDAPVDMVSAGDSGSIAVYVTGKNDTQSMLVATPNGLPGIPVSSGGNYTDENGQQWVCDEIDLNRGVYVRRVFEYVCTGNENWEVSQYQYVPDATRYDGTIDAGHNGTGGTQTLCTHFVYNGVSSLGAWVNERPDSMLQLRILVENTVFASVDELVAFLKEQYTNGTPVTYLCILSTPIETPLSEEEIAAYNALHTYRNHTTVSNDALAHMEIEYAMDAKKYIDSLVISGGGSVARLSSVTLRSSAWTGENGLYSQVVTIDGITEYSKVDLLPSVEQLAIFHNKDVAFVTENEDGVVTVYAIGDKPLLDYNIQAQITEVAV